ncbi:MAG TPA: acyltransferase [Verrucomicrobia bacterium]|nr:acyltransferase [Verrucomicrobiales bacterium]HIL54465.1 acyltransferase [Verrucomicrobiota bacterium]
MPYRPDIDGLRAIAVIGVLLFHADLGVSGGYVGVDVFFVISGFLITGLILKELRDKSFSVLGFWERRVRRIVPALFVVTFATVLLGYVFLLPAEYKMLGSSVLWLSVISSNLFFWKNTNSYFGGASEEMPLLHTWSLSLEEQFYLIVPFVLLVLFRVGKSRSIFWIICSFVILSCGLSIYGMADHGSATFYLLPTRAWELGSGSLVAFAVPIRSVRIRTMMQWVGMICVLIPFFIYDRATIFPGMAAVPPVAGTAILIWAGMGEAHKTNSLQIQRALSMKPLVWIGLLSYSLYLWHWPLLAFNEYLVIWKDSVPVKVFILLSALLLSYFSWKFVEQPIRSRRMFGSERSVFIFSSVAFSLLLICSSLLISKEGMTGRYTEDFLNYTDSGLSEDSFFDYGKASKEFPENKSFLGIEGEEPIFFLWGDSHGMALARAIDAAAKESSIAGESAVKTSTLPVLSWVTSKESQINYNESVLKYLEGKKQKQSIGHVILVGRWWLASNQSYENESSFEIKLINTIDRIKGLGYSVSLVRQVPQWTDHWQTPSSFPFQLEKFSWEYKEMILSEEELEKRFAQQNQMFSKIEKVPGVRIIDPLPLLKGPDGFYHIRDEGGWIYYDDDHLSGYGAMKLKSLFNFLGN